MKNWLQTQHSENEDGGIQSWQIDGETMEIVRDFIFCGSKIMQMVTVAMKIKDTLSLEKKL